MTPEDQQALDHLAQEERREAFQRSMQALLKAPSAYAQATKTKWAPLTRINYIKGQG